MKFGALIPCKAHSIGVLDKNWREIAGKPLWRWTLEAAQDSDVFSIIVCTSNGGFRNHGPLDNTVYLYDDEPKRPDDIGEGMALDWLLKSFSARYDYIDAWLLLQPTSPLRTKEDIRAVADMLEKYDSVVSVSSVGDKFWKVKDGLPVPEYDPWARMIRQSQKTNVLYYENGAVYGTKRWLLVDKMCRIGGKIGLYEMPDSRAQQIDSINDWLVCEATLRVRV